MATAQEIIHGATALRTKLGEQVNDAQTINDLRKTISNINEYTTVNTLQIGMGDELHRCAELELQNLQLLSVGMNELLESTEDLVQLKTSATRLVNQSMEGAKLIPEIAKEQINALKSVYDKMHLKGGDEQLEVVVHELEQHMDAVRAGSEQPDTTSIAAAASFIQTKLQAAAKHMPSRKTVAKLAVLSAVTALGVAYGPKAWEALFGQQAAAEALSAATNIINAHTELMKADAAERNAGHIATTARNALEALYKSNATQDEISKANAIYEKAYTTYTSCIGPVNKAYQAFDYAVRFSTAAAPLEAFKSMVSPELFNLISVKGEGRAGFLAKEALDKAVKAGIPSLSISSSKALSAGGYATLTNTVGAAGLKSALIGAGVVGAVLLAGALAYKYRDPLKRGASKVTRSMVQYKQALERQLTEVYTVVRDRVLQGDAHLLPTGQSSSRIYGSRGGPASWQKCLIPIPSFKHYIISAKLKYIFIYT